MKLIRWSAFIVTMLTAAYWAPVISQEREEDPTAREQWEWMRLHDLATGRIPIDIRRHELAYAKSLPSVESKMENPQKGRSFRTQSIPTWIPRGPYNVGGRTRALAVDVTNSNVILAGGVSGGMWRSSDGGKSWKQTTSAGQLHSVTCVAQDTRPGKTHIWYYGTGEGTGNSATDESYTAIYAGDGIFESVDSGKTWTQLASTAGLPPGNLSISNSFNFVWDLVTDPTAPLNKDVLYAATTGCIQKYTKNYTNGDNGWEVILGQSYDPNASVSDCGVIYSSNVSWYTDVAITKTGDVYATLSQYSSSQRLSPTHQGPSASCSGIFRFDRATQSWTNITPTCIEWWPQFYKRVVIATAPTTPDVVYFFGDTPNSPYAHYAVAGYDGYWTSLWKYTNYQPPPGITLPCPLRRNWIDLSEQLPSWLQAQGSYDLTIKVNPDDPNSILFGTVQLFQGYASWLSHSTNPLAFAADFHAITFDPSDPMTAFVGCDNGILKLKGQSLEYLNNGYITSQFYTIAIDHGTSGSNLMMGGLQDNDVHWTDSPEATVPWNSFSLGEDGSYCAISDGGASCYVTGQYADLYKMALGQGGCSPYPQNVTGMAKIRPPAGTGYLFVNPFVLDATNNNIMYLPAGTDVWRNRSLDQIPLKCDYTYSPTLHTWEKLCSIPPQVSGKISAVAVSKSYLNGSTESDLYFGTNDGRVYRVDHASSVGASVTPQEITSAQFPKNGYVSCVAVHPRNGLIAIVAFSNYFQSDQNLFLTTDGGSNWSPIAGNLRPQGQYGPSLRWVAFGPLVDGLNSLFLATSTGVYSTNFQFSNPTRYLNGNTTWNLEGSKNMGNVVVDMLDIRTSDGLVVAATHGNGVYSRYVSLQPSIIARLVGISSIATPWRNPSWNQRQTGSKLVLNNPSDSLSIPVHLMSTDAHFTLSTDSVLLGPGDSVTVTVRFSPDSTGEYRTEIALDCGAFGQDSLPLSITAVSSPYIFSGRRIDFGPLRGTKSRTDSISITSTNPDSMLIHLSSVGNDFSVPPPDMIFSPYQTRTVYINYTAAESPGPSSGAVIIRTDSSIGFNQSDSILLRGNSTSSAFVVSPVSWHFQDVLEGYAESIDLGVTNASPDSDLSITSIATTDAAFHVSATSATIPPLSTASFTMTFRPTAVGPRSCLIVFADNGSLAGYDTVIVTGTGLDSTAFRTFSAESLATVTDHTGKYKAVKRKADKESFCLSITKQSRGDADGLHMELGSTPIEGTFSSTPSFTSSFVGGKTMDLFFKNEFAPFVLDSGSTVSICGWAEKGKPVKLSKYWWTNRGVQIGAVLRNKSAFTSQVGLYPMPNLHNLGDAVFGGGGFASTNGELIGLGGAHSVLLKKYSDVKKSLNKKGLLHTRGPKCLDHFDNERLITRQQSSLTADKQDNVLFANQVALKLAVKASQMGFTPVGLGELRYDDSSANPLNGKTVDEIIQITDSILTLCSVSDPRMTLSGLDSTIGIINAAFDGPMDTIQFAGGLVLKGVQPLAAVRYLQPSGFTPIRVQPRLGYMDETPRDFILYQNYPNPFNPTTMIEFDLPQPSVVTLKVYNVLGQEVATLIDHEQIDDGNQEREFNAAQLASGVYFYRLIAESLTDDNKLSGVQFSQVKKLLLIK